MRKTELETSYFYIDESGDPAFYDKHGTMIVGQPGCSRVLLLGLVRTDDPSAIRRSLAELRKELANDEYLAQIPSFQKSMRTFHAKDDSPEVRYRVFQTIARMDFKAEVIVARKIEKIFLKRFGGDTRSFYEVGR